MCCAVLIAAFSFCGKTSAYAADAPVEQYEDPEDAEKGHVYIKAVVETGYSPSIYVELIPEFEEGVSHVYTLDESNEYAVSDDIMTGPYGCICYVSRESSRKSDVQVTYGAGSREVLYGQDGPPSFVVVAGSPHFVKEYYWLSDHRDPDGKYLSGHLSEKEVQEIFRYMVEAQDSWQEEDSEEYEDAPPEEYEDPAVGRTQDSPEPQETDTGNIVDETGGMSSVLIAAAAAVIIVMTARIILRRHRAAFRNRGNRKEE